MENIFAKKRLGEVLIEGDWISSATLTNALEEQQRTNEKLGEILTRLGVINEMELKAVLSTQAELDNCPAGEGARQRLGDILLKSKRINDQQLGRALDVQRQTNEKLGEVLVRFGLITDTELQAVLTWQDDCSHNAPYAVKLLLGEILVATDIISRDQLSNALTEQRLTKRQIGDILVEAGYAKPNQIQEALKIQGKLVSAALVAMLSLSALTGCGTSMPIVPTSQLRDATPSITQLNKAARASLAAFTSQSVQTKALRGDAVLLQGEGRAIIDNFPYVHQGADNTCAQASMTMVLAYWKGIAPTADATTGGTSYRSLYQQVINDSNRRNLPTSNDSIVRYLNYKGLQAHPYKNGTVENLKALIDEGRPPIVLLDFGQLAEHYVVVVGYDDNVNNEGDGEGGVVYLQDSVDGHHVSMDRHQFETRWGNDSIKNIPIVGGEKYNHLYFDVQG